MQTELITELSRRAMATEFAVMLPGAASDATDLAIGALEELSQLEALLSVYVEGSDISRLNRQAGRGPIGVSKQVAELLGRSIELARATHGAFDVTAGPLVEAWGFTRRQGRKPTESAIAEARSRVGYDKLIVDLANQTAELLEPGMLVNLGAIGKGYALDVLAKRLCAGGLEHFLIHGGKSSIIARGDDAPGSGLGWKIAISHPLQPAVRLGGLRLINESLATSGSGKQFFHHQGKRLGHVIDPRTGWPAGDMLALTVVCPPAVDADALATGLFVAGLEAAKHFLKARHHEFPDQESINDEKTDGTATSGEPTFRLPLTGLGIVAITPTPQQANVEIRCMGLRPDAWIDDSNVRR